MGVGVFSETRWMVNGDSSVAKRFLSSFPDRTREQSPVLV